MQVRPAVPEDMAAIAIGAVRNRAAALGCVGVDLELARGNDLARSFYDGLGAAACDQIEPKRLPPI